MCPSPAYPMEPTKAGDINITSTGIMLERPKPEEPAAVKSSGTEGSAEDGGAVPVVAADGASIGDTGGPEPVVSPKSEEETVTLTLMGSAFSSKEEQDAGCQLFTLIAAAVDNADVSFGKLSIELTGPGAVAEEVERYVEDLGVAINRKPA